MMTICPCPLAIVIKDLSVHNKFFFGLFIKNHGSEAKHTRKKDLGET